MKTESCICETNCRGANAACREGPYPYGKKYDYDNEPAGCICEIPCHGSEELCRQRMLVNAAADPELTASTWKSLGGDTPRAKFRRTFTSEKARVAREEARKHPVCAPFFGAWRCPDSPTKCGRLFTYWTHHNVWFRKCACNSQYTLPSSPPCVYCGDDAECREHIVPTRAGGQIVVPSCLRCNRRKGNDLYGVGAALPLVSMTQALRLTALFAAYLTETHGIYRKILSDKIANGPPDPVTQVLAPSIETVIEWLRAVEANRKEAGVEPGIKFNLADQYYEEQKKKRETANDSNGSG